MKLAVVGGGSSYTPELLWGLIEQRAALGIDEVVLEDIDEERVSAVAGFCDRMARHHAAPDGGYLRVHATTDQDAALDGAAFVVMQLRVGGNEARHEDILMGTRRGLIGQETTGVGGFAKALRTIPVALDVARAIEARCPEAWLINFTNPSGIVTEALLRFGRERVVGLCNVPIEMHMEIARHLGRPREDLTLDWVGLNHLGWLRRVMLDGQDLMPTILELIESGTAGPANLPEIDYPPGFLKALGMIPSSYVRFFYAGDEMLDEIVQAPETRAQTVLGLERELFEVYRDGPAHELPAQLSQRGGAWYSRMAIDVLAALVSDAPSTHIVNTLNRGAIGALPDDASVEVPCAIDRDGVRPQPCDPVDESILGLIRQVKSYERLTIDAALAEDRAEKERLALLALLANPLVPTAKLARAVVDDLIARDHI